MQIAVYGVTGMVGSRVAAEATARGHEVYGFSRSGGEGVTVADAGETEAVAEVARRVDVLVFALSPDRQGGPHEPFVEAFERLVGSGITTRILVVTGAGSLEVDGVRLIDSPDFPEMFKPEGRTMGRVLETLRAAPESLDWTAVSPAPQIAPGERTGSYSSAGDTPAGEAISAEDFAVAIVDEIEQPAHRRARFTVAS